jgi:hypothetical protein
VIRQQAEVINQAAELISQMESQEVNDELDDQLVKKLQSVASKQP